MKTRFYGLNARESTYQQRSMTQLRLWREGFPVHNDVDNECVPDWSCCEGHHWLAPERLRRKFCDDPNSRGLMLIWFADALAARDPLWSTRVDLDTLGGELRLRGRPS